MKQTDWIKKQPERKFRNMFKVVLMFACGIVSYVAFQPVFKSKNVARDGMEKDPENHISIKQSYDEWLLSKSGSSLLAKELGGDEIIDTIKMPEQVFSFRIVDGSDMKFSPIDILIDKGPVFVDPQMIAEISKMLCDEKTYRSSWKKTPEGTFVRRPAKGCYPYYNILLRFEKKPSIVDLYLSYDCNQMLTVVDGKPMEMVDFSPGRTTLMSVAQKLFPNDSGLHRLEQIHKP